MRLFSLAFLLLFFIAAPSEVKAGHWFEAEDFKGNSTVLQSATSSGGAFVEGRTWYHILGAVPFPQDGDSYNVWIRAQSDLPANWYLRENTGKKRIFGWFSTEKPDEWTWIKLGSFSASIGKTFHDIFLQRPKNQSIPTATGRIDVIVISKTDDAATLEKLLNDRLAGITTKTLSTLDRENIATLVASRRMADIPYVENPPVLDGILDDAAWKQAAKISDFTLQNGKNMASEQTIGYIAYDKDKLYIAAELLESQLPFVRKIRTIRNDSVWTDDCLEVFLDPGFSQKEYLHFIVNPLGTQQDNLATRLDRVTAVGEKGLDWKAAASIGEDRWFVELEIPWRLLDAAKPEAGEIWGFNLNREQQPKNEASHWNFVGGQFHQPDRFGLLSFGKKSLALEAVRFGELFETLTFSLKANTEPSKNLSVKLKITENGKVIEEKSQNMVVGTEKTRDLTFSLPLDKPGVYDLTAVIADADETLYTLAFPFKTYSDKLVSVAWPPEMRENKLHIARNTAQHCFFLFANHFPDNRPIYAVQFEVSVPEKVKLLDPQNSLMTSASRYNQVTAWDWVKENRDGQSYHKYTMKLERGISPSRIENVRFFQNSLMLFFELEQGAFPDAKQLPVYFNLKAGDFVEEENVFHLVILPELIGIQPKEILLYNWLWTFNENPQIWKPYMETMKKTGFNAINCSTDNQYYCLEAKKQNHKVINNLYWFWQNNDYLLENPEHTALTFKQKKATGSNPLVCLSIMIENNGELIRQTLAPYMEVINKRLVDGYVWDLEHPAVWDVCFCDRCISEFRKFAQLQESEVLNPQNIREKFAKEWVLFATHQSSMTSRIIREELKKHNPDAIWGVYSGMPSQMTMESYRCNWDELAKYIDMALPTGYSNSPAALNKRFVSGWKNFIQQINQATAPGQRVETIPTLTAGYERGQGMQPSADLNRMQILRSVASGAHGVSFWWWGPMDGLYYQEIGRASALIAKYEDFFVRGKSNNDIVSMEEHSYGLNVSWEVFSLEGKHLFILFNHNDKETRTLNFSFRNIPPQLSGYFYPDGKKFVPHNRLSVTVKPLETAVIELR